MAQSSSQATFHGSKFTTDALFKDVDDLYNDISDFAQVHRPQQQVVELNGQLIILRDVSERLRAVSSGRSTYLGCSAASQLHWDRLWLSVNSTGDHCRLNILGPLHSRLEQIMRSSMEPFKSRTELRLPPDGLVWYENTFKAMDYCTDTLQMLLAAIQLARSTNEFNVNGTYSSAELGLVSSLHSLIVNMRQRLFDTSGQANVPGALEIRQALEIAHSFAQTLPTVSMNKHYDAPNPSNSHYTGRRQQLQVIEDAFSAPKSSTQKRLIIEGGPGSGKTELALKYAQEHKSAYWGVFWVDASSRSTAKQSYAEIARTFGLDANEKSAKHWLSICCYKWLLIIDNADGDEIKLNDLVPPESVFGCILVTTRNPKLRSPGDNCLELKAMNDEEGPKLLLLAAAEEEPWTPKIDLAVAICKRLYYLPLALMHAGNAIKNKICTLGTFINFFDHSAERIRYGRIRSRSRSRSRGQEDKDLDRSMPIYGSSGILFDSLEKRAERDETYRNALELLQMFSYMHFNNIRLDVLVQSTVGPIQEAMVAEKGQQEEESLVCRLDLKMPPQTLGAWVRDTMRKVLRTRLFASPPVIPDMLKGYTAVDEADLAFLESDIKFHLQDVLRILVSMGLVMELGYDNERDNGKGTHRYHIHPLMHKWVRERKQLSSAEDALFCQMATTVLSRAVRLLGEDTEDAKVMRRDMVPHINHVRDCAIDIQKRIHDNHRRNLNTFPSMPLSASESNFGALQAEENGRFSRVYLETGAYRDAEKLLRQTMGFVIPRLGEDHTVTGMVKIGLSMAVWHQTRYNETTELLREVYESRGKTLGARHPQTLEIMTKLGTSVLYQGFMTGARHLHETALTGLEQAYGQDHRKTLMCRNEIGRVHWYLFNWDESMRHHNQAIEGLQRLMLEDPSVEEDLLACKEDLAMSKMRLGDVSAIESVQMMRDSVQRRVLIQGAQHPLTLLAKAKLGQALGICRQFNEAETLLRETLKTAVQNYGEDHLVILAGKSWYAQVLMGMGQLDRAEAIFRETTDRTKYAKAAAKDGEHPDRIFHVWRLAECLEKQGNFLEALERCRELQESIPKIGGHGLGPNHKFNTLLNERIENLERQLRVD